MEEKSIPSKENTPLKKKQNTSADWEEAPLVTIGWVPLSCSWENLEGCGPQDFTWERESLQFKLALGRNRISNFLVRPIFQNILHLLSPLYYGVPQTGPSKCHPGNQVLGKGSQASQFPEDFHRPYHLYFKATQAHQMIFISQVRKRRLTEEEVSNGKKLWTVLLELLTVIVSNRILKARKKSCFHFAAEEIDGLESSGN